MNTKYQTACENLHVLLEKGMTLTEACFQLGYARQTLTRHYYIWLDENKTTTETVVLSKQKQSTKFLKTDSHISFYNGEVFNVDLTNPNYDKIYAALIVGDLDLATKLSSLKNAIEKDPLVYKKIEIVNSKIFHNGIEIHGSLVDKIVHEFSTSTVGFEKYVKFLNKLLKNPSTTMKTRIFDFLQFNDIQISEDGDILAFKKVASDYKDLYRGVFDNSPGKECKMPRNEVDDRDNVTCSYGLHVCSKTYLEHYSSMYDVKIVLCKINPKHVVSIPTDYNNAKMRCSKYIVVSDVTDTIM